MFLNLPGIIFNSEKERQRACLELIYRSRLNDIFSDYRPTQTRIILSNIKRGYLLEYYHYYYIYYFDNFLTQWDIYGGIEADSITMKNYLSFTHNYSKSKIKEIETKLNLKWSQIVEKSKNDSLFEQEVLKLHEDNFRFLTYYNKLEITLDSFVLTLKKIDFRDATLNGQMNFNFPIQDIQQRINHINLINGKLLEFDENVEYLMFLRKEITNDAL